MRVGYARYRIHAPPQLLGHAQVRRPVVADRPNVDLGRQTEIEDLGDHVGRLKIEDRLGECGRQHLAQCADVVGRRRMSLLEGDQDHAVIGVDGRSIGECEIIRPLRYPDIVDDEIAILLGNDLPDLVLDRLEKVLGRLDTSGGRCADVQLDLPSVDGRKEVAPDQHQHRSGEREYQQAGGRNSKPVFEQCPKQSSIALAHVLEGALKGTVEAGEQVCRRVVRRAMMLALEQKANDDRGQRPRQGVGRQHREHDGEPERGEQKLRRSLEEDDRSKHAADGERRDHGWHGNAGRAV